MLALLLCAGCQSLDPAVAYREAARSLRFHLDRVEPRLDFALPLDRSRLRLRLHLGIENPSNLRLAAKVLGGNLSLKVGAGTHAIGRVGFPAGLDLAPSQRSETVAEIAFDYRAIKQAWGPLSEAINHPKAAIWHLEGEARVEVLGFPVTLPLRATHGSGPPSDHPPIGPSPGRSSRSPGLAEGAP
jgi:hypothetical protein